MKKIAIITLIIIILSGCASRRIRQIDLSYIGTKPITYTVYLPIIQLSQKNYTYIPMVINGTNNRNDTNSH
jgi:uncharacterized protein YceK